MSNTFEMAGKVSLFGFRAAIGSFRRPFECSQIVRQIAEVGSESVFLVIASGFALGTVDDFAYAQYAGHLRRYFAVPTAQAFAFFLEIGPLVTGLLVAGRVGSKSGRSLCS